MLSDKHNLVTVKAMGLIILLFDIVSVGYVPFGIPQCVQSILHGLTSVSFVSHSSLLTVKGVDLAVAQDDFHS